MEQQLDATGPAQRPQVLYSILEYLQDVKRDESLNEDSLESLDVASQCLSSAFGIDLNDEQQKQKYSIKPQNLPQVLAFGLVGKQKIAEALDKIHKKQQEVYQHQPDPADIEFKFNQYLQAVKQKGFFNGANPGTVEYEQRYLRARQKFIEKHHPNAVVPPSATTSTKAATPTPTQPKPTPTVSVEGLSQKEREEQAEKFKVEGNSFLASKDMNKAVECYSNAIVMNPNNAIYYANRAAAYSHMDLHEKAIADCLESIRINPNYSKAYGRLGLAYFSVGKYEEAVQEYRKGLELEPNSPSLKASLDAAEQKLRERNAPPPSSSAAAPNFSEMLNNPDLLSSLGGMFGGGGNQPGAQPGGGLNLGSILSNPMFQNMAQQMMSNPQMMNMASNLMQNPDTVSSLMNAFGGAPQGNDEPNENQ